MLTGCCRSNLSCLLFVCGLVLTSHSATTSAAPPNVTRGQSADPTMDGPGLNSRVGFIAGQTVGRDNSIGHVELLPWMPVGTDWLLLGDGRFFFDTEGNVGANIGAGFRRQLSGDRAVGLILWYDFDDTSGELYQQITTSFEATSDNWDLYGNIYIPTGDTRQRFSIAAQNTRFSGNSVLYDQVEDVGEALTGFDLEVGVLLPSEFAANHRVKAFAGGYHYSGDTTDDVTGVMGRMEGNLWDMIDGQIKLTNDSTFGTNLIAGISISLSGRYRDGTLQRDHAFDRMTQFAHRSYNVVAPRADITTSDIAATNAATGSAYTIQHVSGNSGAGLGTFASPFSTVAEAQAAGGDIFLVHSDTVISGTSITLTDGQRLFGEGDGIVNTIDIPEIGSLALPETGTGTSRPIFESSPSDGIVLSSNTEVAGIVIRDASGAGIKGTDVSNIVIRDVDIADSIGEGILLTNPSGTIELTNNTISSFVVFDALKIDGGDANIVASGTLSDGGVEPLISISNTTGGSVDLTDTEFLLSAINTQFTDNAADLTFADVSLSNSKFTFDNQSGNLVFNGTTTTENGGIDILNSSGNVTFAELVATGPGRSPLTLTNNTGTTTIASLNSNTTAGAGIIAQNAGTLVIESGSISTTDNAAIDITDTTIDISLQSVSVDGGATGIALANTPGSFSILGDGTDTANSGGTIANTTTGVDLQNTENVALRYLTLSNNGTAVQGSTITSLAIWDSAISNSTGIAIDVTDAQRLEIYNSAFTDNGTTTDSTVNLLATTDDTFNWLIVGNTMSTDAGTSLAVASSTNAELALTTQDNVITSTQDDIDILTVDWTGAGITNITNNTFNSVGDNGSVVSLLTQSTTDTMAINFQQNTLLVTGSDTTGLKLVTNAPSTNRIESNTFQLTNIGNAIDLTLSTGSNTGLISNWVDGGTRGIWFRSIAGPANIQIDSNLIEFSNLTGVTDEGIRFDGLSGDVELFGSTNNLIENATTPLFLTAGTATGSFFINGVAVQ